MSKKERFNEAFAYLKYKGVITKQDDVAQAIGSTKSNVSLALSGNAKVLTDKFIIRFCKKYSIIRMEWLMNGTGEMLNQSNDILSRIKHLIDLSGLSYADFAKNVGIPAFDFEKKLEGTIEVTDDDISNISNALNVRIGWLYNGTGQTFRAPEKMRQQAIIDSYRAKKLNEEANEERMSNHESSTILEIYSKTIRQLEDDRALVKEELQALAILHQQMEKELGEVRDLKAMLHDAIEAIRSSSVNNNTMLMAAEDN